MLPIVSGTGILLDLPDQVRPVFGQMSPLLAADSSPSATGRPIRAVPLDWLHPLHGDEAFGLTGRPLALVAGLAPIALFGTGLLRWRRPRPRRRHGCASAGGRASQKRLIA